MEERHTGDNLADELEKILTEWEIREKVVAIVTDNAQNMLNAISFLSGASDHTNISSMGCAAHTLQLAVNKALRPAPHLRFDRAVQPPRFARASRNKQNLMEGVTLERFSRAADF